jgi:hypothetical protein
MVSKPALGSSYSMGNEEFSSDVTRPGYETKNLLEFSAEGKLYLRSHIGPDGVVLN